MTPDAVVRLIEGADEIGARIGQREPIAPADRVVAELPRIDPVHVRQLEGNELHEIELARSPEQHSSAVRSATLYRVRRPGGIA